MFKKLELSILVLSIAFFDGSVLYTEISNECWEITEHLMYIGPLEKHPYDTRDGCLELCLNTPQCSIVNIDIRSTSSCWVQKEIYVPDRGNFTPTNLVFSFFLDRKCKGLFPAIDMKCWTIKNRSHHPGFIQAPINNLYDCLNLCIGLPQCGAIEFDEMTRPFPCWMQDVTFQFKNYKFMKSSTTTFYMFNRTCWSVGDIYGTHNYVHQCWKGTPNHHIYVGLEQFKGNDLDVCSNLCYNMPQCEYFDFDPTRGEKCWVQTKPVSSLQKHKTATNYKIDRKCYAKLLSEASRCWIVTPDSQYHGSTLVKTPYDDIIYCLAYCKLFPQCGVLNFDLKAKNGKCWIQTDFFEPNLSDLKPKPSTTNYLLDRRCYDTASGVDLSCWEINNRMSYDSNMGLHDKANQLSDCLAKCRKKPVCHIVNFEFTSNHRCWIQKEYWDFDQKMIRPNNASLNFILKPHCYKESKRI